MRRMNPVGPNSRCSRTIRNLFSFVRLIYFQLFGQHSANEWPKVPAQYMRRICQRAARYWRSDLGLGERTGLVPSGGEREG
jgi:hypothetical protein